MSIQNSYYAYAPMTISRMSDGSSISGSMVVKVVEGINGTYFYAVSDSGALPSEETTPMVRETTEVVVDRAKKLEEENKGLWNALAERDRKIEQLQEQNQQMQNFLMETTRTLVEKLNGPGRHGADTGDVDGKDP